MQTRKKLVEALNCVAKFQNSGKKPGDVLSKTFRITADNREDISSTPVFGSESFLKPLDGMT